MTEDKTKKEQNNNSVKPSAENALDKANASVQSSAKEEQPTESAVQTASSDKKPVENSSSASANTKKEAKSKSNEPEKSTQAVDKKEDQKNDSSKKTENNLVEKSAEAKPAVQSAEAKEKAERNKESVKKPEAEKKESLKLNGLFAFKMSMSTFYNDKGESIPVTALKYEPCFVSQIKTEEKESYSAVQVAFKAQKNKRCSKALIKHLAPAGFKEGARFVKEVRQALPEGIKLGQELSIKSVQKGDLVKISSLSKGRGFTGAMKRWNFAGGKASHGSKTHRRTGSIGQHTEPARVFPGRKMPGRYGFQKVSRSKVPVVDVLTEEGIIFVKGSVPGARNTLVSIQKI